MNWPNPMEILIEEELFNQLVDATISSASVSEMKTIVMNNSKFMNIIEASLIVKTFLAMDAKDKYNVVHERFFRKFEHAQLNNIYNSYNEEIINKN